jgi:hypothetical protein
MPLTENDNAVTHPRRIESMSRSAYPFCASVCLIRVFHLERQDDLLDYSILQRSVSVPQRCH